MKKGHIDSVYLMKPAYLNHDGKEEEVIKVEVKEENEVPFRPAKTVPDRLYKAPYEHMTDLVALKKNYRDADGHVITQPRNFYTMPAKKGVVGKQTFFNPFPTAIKDDFNWANELAHKEFERKKKLE